MKFQGPKSVFGRTFLLLVVAGGITQAMILFLVRGPLPSPRQQDMYVHNIKRYADFLAQEIAQDPREEHAREVLQGTAFDAGVRGAVNWNFELPPPLAEPTGPRKWEEPPTLDEKGRPLFEIPVRTAQGDIVVSLRGPFGPWSQKSAQAIPPLLAVILIVFVCTSLAIRQILRPIRSLSEAFDKVKTGKTDVSVALNRNDELGRLSRSFNEMAASLHFMIKDKEQLFTELSHEFRAPIARAQAANALLEDPELRDLIQENLAELDSLIHALLTAAKLEAGNSAAIRESFDVADLLEEVGSLFPQSADRLTLNRPEGELICEADRRSLRMLLRNLLENALKYSGGRKPVHLSAGLRDDRVFWEVRDEGPGISPEELSRLFDPFFRGADRTKISQPGFGLGLSLCRRIARAHGGDLRIESTLGKGTTISAWIPARVSSPLLKAA